jgi:hypothetical protein
VVLVSEDEPEGAALLDASRENCTGALSLLPPAGLRHFEAVASEGGRATLAGLLAEALGELLLLV